MEHDRRIFEGANIEVDHLCDTVRYLGSLWAFSSSEFRDSSFLIILFDFNATHGTWSDILLHSVG